MINGTRVRVAVACLLVLALMGVLGVGLANAAFPTTKTESAINFDPEKETTLRGVRGKILDANGQPMAYNKPSYDVQFIRETQEDRYSKNRPIYTETIIKTIEIVKRNGGKIIDTYPIYRDEEGKFYFNWQAPTEKSAAARKKRWMEDMGLNETMQPEEIYEYMRGWLYIPETYTYEEAREVLSIWNDIQRNSSQSYLPITIASNITEDAVAEIESRSSELKGISTARSTMRVYPQNEYASHVIGYTGKLTTLESEEIKRKESEEGYSQEDRIGVSGIEKTMESYLTGSTKEHHGKQVLEVTRKNEVVRQIESVAPTDGDDVVLTIDMDLQKVAYDALKENIEKTHAEQEEMIEQNVEKYTAKLNGRELSEIKKAESGSVVVMQANTGKVISMVSYPSYNNNDFIVGMTKEEYKKYGDEDTKDNKNFPLLNRAIASKTMPGSIFKMATGLAALQEGVVTIDETISDEGYYIVKEQRDKGNLDTTGAPKCWISLDRIHEHADQDLRLALKNSCNYYFFTIAERMGIDAMAPRIEKMGLATKTGVELPGEVQGRIGGQKVLFDNTGTIDKNGLAGLVQRQLVRLLKGYCESANIKITDEERFEATAERLMRLVDAEKDSGEYGPAIREIMQEELGIPQVLSSSRSWAVEVYSIIRELKWNPNQTIRTAIGQAVVEVTPIAAARYVSSLVNGGTVYNASIVDRVIDKDGKTIQKFDPIIAEKLETDPAYLEAIKEGMHGVFSAEDGSSTQARFGNFDYTENMGGKTGTAQVSTARNNIDIENTSWLVSFVPYDNPEIVIVSCIPNGYAGIYSDTVHKRIVTHYLEKQQTAINKTVIENNGILN